MGWVADSRLLAGTRSKQPVAGHAARSAFHLAIGKLILINVAYQRPLMLGPDKPITILTAHVRAKQPTPVRLSETVGLGDVRFLIALIAADAGQNDHRANPCFVQMTLVNQMHAC